MAHCPAGTVGKKDARGTLTSSSGGPGGRNRLPCDTISIPSPGHHPPAANGFGREPACAKDVVASTNRGVGTNATAAIPVVGGNCGGGRPPSGSGSGEVGPRFVNSTWLRSGSVARDAARPVDRPPDRPAKPIVSRTVARGHAAKRIRSFFVTGLVATSRGVVRAVARLVTAETTAREPSNE